MKILFHFKPIKALVLSPSKETGARMVRQAHQERFNNHKKLMIFILFLASGSLYAASGCAIKKVFHHRTPEQHTAGTLSLGSVMFYCNHMPSKPRITQEDVQGSPSRKQVTLFFESMEIAQDAHPMIEEFNKRHSDLYSAQIIADPMAPKGIALRLEYDPMQVAFSYDFCETITRDKGIVVWFYNKKLLDELHKKEQRLLQTAFHSRPTIIIDCGHGGFDMGTVSTQGVAEKNVVLAVGKQLESSLKKAGFAVCMTRSDDMFVPLDERTTMANAQGPTSIFISLHANNSPSEQTSGIETFCLDRSLFSSGDFTTMIDVMAAPAKDSLYASSEKLAQSIHRGVLTKVSTGHANIVDRKVKHAVAQVLVGTVMPSALIELGFLSHPQERERLSDVKYQQFLAQGIQDGIINFLKKN